MTHPDDRGCVGSCLAADAFVLSALNGRGRRSRPLAWLPIGVLLILLLAGSALLLVSSQTTASSSQGSPGSTTDSGAQEARAAYAQLPATFTRNAGQLDRRVDFYSQGPGYGLYFSRGEATFAFQEQSRRGLESLGAGGGLEAALSPFEQRGRGVALKLRFLGASPGVRPEARDRAPGRVNYLRGDDSAASLTGLPTYHEVVYRDLWPGVDMVFRGAAGQLKYEFHLRPGADPSAIRLAYLGADGASLDAAGNLALKTELGTLKDSRPASYQEIAGRRVQVPSRFVLGRSGAGRASYGLAVRGYDPARPLVIDPGLVYSTYLGGSGFEQGVGAAVDAAGSAYVTGLTLSSDFPTTAGAFDTSANGGQDAFVTKLNATGSGLVYSTYLGGSGTDQGTGIAVDATGTYVTGGTASSDFPTTAGAYDTSFNGGIGDAFVTKLDSTGSALLYSTYVGGAARDFGDGIAVDAVGNAYVTGLTESSDFPTTAGAFDTSFNGGEDGFVSKLNTTGSTLAYSTYLGGSANDIGQGIAVDGAGSAHVTGATHSSDFPTTAGAFDTSFNGGTFDGFVSKLNTTGSTLAYSTYLGGSSFDSSTGITLDAAGSAYVTGATQSLDFPTTAGAFDTSFNGAADLFVTKLDATGSSLVYSTYLGGSGDDESGSGIALDAAGSAHVTGATQSLDFPTTAGAFDTSANGGFDVLATKLNSTGSALVYSTYLGGSGDEFGSGIAVDATGAYLTGFTVSSDFPTTAGAFDTSANGSLDAFVTKLDLIPTVSTPLCVVAIKGGRITANNGDTATFGGVAAVSSSGTPRGEEQYHDHGPVQPLRMNSTQIQLVVCTNTTNPQASISGLATIDGSGSHPFTIEVEDNGEPGVGTDTYRIVLPDQGYDSGEQTLEGGNIQIFAP